MRIINLVLSVLLLTYPLSQCMETAHAPARSEESIELNMHHIGAQYLQPTQQQINQLTLMINHVKKTIEKKQVDGQDIRTEQQQLSRLQQAVTRISGQHKTEASILALFSDNSTYEKSTSTSSFIEPTALVKDLYITDGPEGHPNMRLCKVIKRILPGTQHKFQEYTRTTLGDMKLTTMLALPPHDIEIVKSRREAIRILAQNAPLVNQIQDRLERLGRLEDNVLTFWQSDEVEKTLTHSPALSGIAGTQLLNNLKQLNTNSEMIFAGDAFGVFRDIQLLSLGWFMSSKCIERAYSTVPSWDSLPTWQSLKNATSLPSLEAIKYTVAPSLVGLLTYQLCNYITKDAQSKRIKEEINKIVEEVDKLNRLLPNTSLNQYFQKKVMQNAIELSFSNDTAMQIFEHVAEQNNNLLVSKSQRVITLQLTPCAQRETQSAYFTERHKTSLAFATAALTCFITYYLSFGLPVDALFTLSFSNILNVSLVAIPGAICTFLYSATSAFSCIKGVLYDQLYKKQKQVLQSIEQQRKAFLSLALLIQETKELFKLLKQYPQLYQLLELGQHLDVENSVHIRIHKRLSSLGHLATTNKQAKKLTQTTQTQLQHATDLFTKLNTQCPKDLDTYLQQKPSFLGKAWHRLNSNTIMSGYNQMLHVREFFGLPLEAIAELDVYACLAKQIIDQPQRFCLVDFIEVHQPMLHTQNLWNPLLLGLPEPTCGVVNDFSIDNYKLACIAGKPESGKSTFVRSVGMAVIMAHTLGVAPAKSFTTSHFQRLFVSMSKQDNIAQGISGFRGEEMSMENIVEKVAQVDGPCFVLTDEIFQRARKDVGGPAAANFLTQKLLPLNNAASIVITHYDEPLELAKIRSDCKNYFFPPKTSEQAYVITTVNTLGDVDHSEG